MCGIAGVISASSLNDRDVASFHRMLGAMYSRGPDGQGEFRSADGQALFGMRRLSIIDLTGGWQPLYNEDRSITMVANGEVYNFVELRRELESLGHRFNTKSDCECIAHAYEQWGMDFVHKLRGMYAFCLHDRHKNKVIIGRDRVGEKPLYLFEDNNQIWFASELKGLVSSGRFKFELDAIAVNEYMHYGWIPEPRSPLVRTRKLPPASFLEIDLNPWRVREHKYWSMSDAPAIDADPIKTVRDELEVIAEQIIRSDVPVGVALSGGVDSSAIAALAHSKYPGVMNAFTVGWKGRPPQDERHLAKQLADHLKMPIHEIEVDPQEMAEFFPTLCLYRDDPIADVSGQGYYLLAKLARQHGCPVLLMGQGGDELFWGYPWATRAVRESMYKDQHGHPSRSGYLDLLPKRLARPQMVASAYKLGGLWHGWGRVAPDASAPREQLVCYDLNTTYMMGEWAGPRLFTSQFIKRLGSSRAADFFTRKLPWGRVDVAITELQCNGYLLENGLQQGDRLAMASAVELRLPLVDYKLIETVIGLRKAHPDHDLEPKAWLKGAISDVVPDWVFNRPKRGMNPPGTLWANVLRERYGSILADGFLVQHGVITPEAAKTLAQPHKRLSAWNDVFVKVIALEWWSRKMAELASGGTMPARPELEASARTRVVPVGAA